MKRAIATHNKRRQLVVASQDIFVIVIVIAHYAVATYFSN
jgi:hypothetical protein